MTIWFKIVKENSRINNLALGIILEEKDYDLRVQHKLGLIRI